MRFSGTVGVLSVVVAAACFASACSSLLGLGDFKDAPADAGSSGGSAGSSGGSAGTGGTAGTAGSGGVAGKDGGSDASDAGKLDCSPTSSVYSVLSAADVGNVNLDPLLVADGPAVSATTKPHVFVIAGGGQAGTFVRSLTDESTNPVKSLMTYSPSPTFKVEGAYADKSNLYLLGQQGGNLVEEAFPLDAGGEPQDSPTPKTLAAQPCSGGIQNACYMRNGNSIHTAVTCQEQDPEAGSMLALYLDGDLVGRGPNTADDFIVRGCAEVGSTYVVQTGADFGPTSLRYGTSYTDLQTAHPISFDSDPGRTTVIGPPIAVPGHGMLLMGMAFGTPPNYAPIHMFSGILPVASFGDLDKDPVPGLWQGPTLSDIKQLFDFHRPDVGQSLIQAAGPDVSGANLGLTAVSSSSGRLLLFGSVVHTADLQTSKVAAGGVGTANLSTVVVWEEQSAEGGTDQHVLGQTLLCSGG